MATRIAALQNRKKEIIYIAAFLIVARLRIILLVLLDDTVLSFKNIARFLIKYEAQSKYHSARNPVKRLLSVFNDNL